NLAYILFEGRYRRHILGDDKSLTVWTPGRLLQDVELGAVREPVLEERGEQHPLVASRFGQVVLDETSPHRLVLCRRTIQLTCRAAEVPMTTDTWENLQGATDCLPVKSNALARHQQSTMSPFLPRRGGRISRRSRRWF